MLGIYFSGTGNTKHCLEVFVEQVDSSAPCISIEDKAVADIIKQLVKSAEEKITNTVQKFKSNTPTQEWIGFFYHMAGLFGQRLWFYNKTRQYSDKLKINADKCVGCVACVNLCPMANLTLTGGKAQSNGKCTMCYRCVNHCLKQAITLLGHTLHEQCASIS